MFQLAVFDMAGTTINDRDEVYRVLREAVERKGAKFTDDQFQEHMGTEKRYAITKLFEIGGVDADEDLIDESFEWFRQELIRTYTDNPPTPLEGIEDMLAHLRELGVKTALTTGFSREVTSVILDGMGWEIGKTIDCSVAGDEVKDGRPEPDMIQKAMKETGVTDTDKVISSGDTAADVRSAQAAGVTSVGVLTGHLTKEDFRELEADHVLESAAKIVEIIKE